MNWSNDLTGFKGKERHAHICADVCAYRCSVA
jgi:hypothetical protein